MIKLNVRGHTLKYSARKKRSRENTLTALEHKIKKLEIELINEDIHEQNKIFSREENEIELGKIRDEVKQIVNYKTKGAIARTRQNWIKFGEKSSSYFFNLEKYNYMSKTRYKIRGNKGQIITNPKEILKIQENFYAKLYRDNEDQKMAWPYLDGIEAPKLTNEQKEYCDQEITSLEIREAIKQLRKERTPGNDGFPIEWYHTFYDTLKPILVPLFREISRYGLPNSSKQGIISLLEKPGRDQLEISQWRPLSLLNCDGKIYAKILSNRLNTVIDYLVSDDQFGFRKGKYIGENILELISTIDLCNKKDLPALIISLDLEKAFDKVLWSSMITIFKFFNFGDKYCHMIEMLYKEITSCTTNNGFSSNYITIQRGLRQGCPFSPSAFTLIVEILALKIKQNKDIKGIPIKAEKQKKIAQYADDLWAVLMATEECVSAFFKETQEFANHTGLKVNYNKTQVMRIGSLRNSNAKCYAERQLQWSDCVKVLGLDIYPSSDKLYKNYEITTCKIEKILNSWKLRGLTPIGKIMVVNTLATSQLIYKLFVLPTPSPEYFKGLRKIITKFIWDEKPPKVAYKTLIQRINKGGLQLIDLETRDKALKSTWIKKSFEDTGWKEIVNQLIPIELNELCECNLHCKDVRYIVEDTPIWLAIMQAWTKYSFYKPETINEIATQKLWYNSWIRSQNRPIRYRKLQQAGVDRICDIYDFADKRFKTFQEIQYDYGNEVGTFLEYNVLVAAIPEYWKKTLKQEKIKLLDIREDSERENLLNNLCQQSKVSKFMYTKILEKNHNIPDGARIIWNDRLNIQLQPEQWEKIRVDSYYLTIVTKLRYFQFRILSNRLVTKYERAKWDNTVNPNCEECAMSDTVVHILINCQKAQKLWKALNRWLQYMCNTQIKIDRSIIILNNYKGKHQWIVNTIILLTKQYLYATYCMKEQCKFINLLSKIRELQQAERELAVSTGKLTKHNKKWKIINEAL